MEAMEATVKQTQLSFVTSTFDAISMARSTMISSTETLIPWIPFLFIKHKEVASVHASFPSYLQSFRLRAAP